jgi:hypothetical protein
MILVGLQLNQPCEVFLNMMSQELLFPIVAIFKINSGNSEPLSHIRERFYIMPN